MRPVVELDVAWIAPADLEAVDALARLQLAATRRGVRLRLRDPSADLLHLLRLAGLAEAFAPEVDDAAAGHATGQPSLGPSRAGSAERS